MPYSIYLSMPTGGPMLPCAVVGMRDCTNKGLMVNPEPKQFGDIPHNFNMAWCEALRNRANGCTHFAMLHSDVSPQSGWLDVLIEEMDRVDADVMSAIIAIKDSCGLTTTGVRYPGVWGCRRFVMREIVHLPETFSIADTDEPGEVLAINTGCWICRLPQAGWPDKFPGFQSRHRIKWEDGQPVPDFDSEDWIFSEWAASQGLRVFATRKVAVGHQGAAFYPNTGAWGMWETDLNRPRKPMTMTFPDPQLRLDTEYPVAVHSVDHTHPFGTARDNSVNYGFNRKLFELVPARDARVLDLGCAGGGLVRSILEVGGFAVGIEGSDYSQNRKRAEWGAIPEYLFTADATKPFTLNNCSADPVMFNVISAWEFWEHIAQDQIGGVIENIKRHAAPGAFMVGSISRGEEIWHKTVKPREWWIDRFARSGFWFDQTLLDHFGHNLVRGSADPSAVSYAVAFRQ